MTLRNAKRSLKKFAKLHTRLDSSMPSTMYAIISKDSETSSDTGQGVDPKYAANSFEAAKRFFELPTEKKMEVFTGLVPNEFVGYHPMEHYARNKRAKKGRKQRALIEQRTDNVQIFVKLLTGLMMQSSIPRRKTSTSHQSTSGQQIYLVSKRLYLNTTPKCFHSPAE